MFERQSAIRLLLSKVVVLALVAVLLSQVATTRTSSAQSTSFGEGLVLVGSDITAGRYVAFAIDNCFWERLSGLGNTADEVVANDFIGDGAQVIVDIAPTDVAFESNDCGSWTLLQPNSLVDVSTPLDGIWLVGEQIRPGTYRTVNQVTSCYWERLTDFSSEVSGRITNDFVSSGQAAVEILASDVGFNASRCGQWQRVQLPGTCDGLTPTVNLATGVGTPTAGDDVILGTAGPDTINALGGNDVVCAGDGDDIVVGGDGNDVLLGEGGRDILRGGPGSDVINGGAGNDRLLGGVGGDTMNGGAGNDYIGGFGGNDVIDGGPGNETIFGGFGADQITAGDGDDRVFGLIGNDTIDGGAGNDVLNGDRGNDVIMGGPGNDVIKGGNASDVLNGNGGDDEISGGKADDSLAGGGGIDVCIGNAHFVADTVANDCETFFGIP